MELTVKQGFPFVTRMIALLFNEGFLPNVLSVEIEPEYGYVTRLTYLDGSVRMTRANDVGLNSGAAGDVVKDKAYTKYFLARGNISTIPGSAFLSNWWSDRLDTSPSARISPTIHRTFDDVLPYINADLQLPVYVKPVDGSKGQNVWCCRTEDEVTNALGLFERERVKVALVEAAIAYPDFRLVVLDDELISAYQRVPLSVVGDGRSSISELLREVQADFIRDGRDTSLRLDDPRIHARLGSLSVTQGTVLASGVVVQLHDISNLSAGGIAVDLSTKVAGQWVDLAVNVSRMFGLRFSGIDLACADLCDSGDDYYVIEVNATPGLDHYGSVGVDQEKVVRQLYAQVLNLPPH